MIGPCAKRRVFATLVTTDNRTFSAENLCMNPQAVCPRLPGEGYAKCRDVCQSIGHAEALALDEAYAADADPHGGTVFVSHHYACGPCTAQMDAAGVHIVCTAPVDSERTPDQ